MRVCVCMCIHAALHASEHVGECHTFSHRFEQYKGTMCLQWYRFAIFRTVVQCGLHRFGGTMCLQWYRFAIFRTVVQCDLYILFCYLSLVDHHPISFLFCFCILYFIFLAAIFPKEVAHYLGS